MNAHGHTVLMTGGLEAPPLALCRKRFRRFERLPADDLKPVSRRVFKERGIVAVRDLRTPLRCFECTSTGAECNSGYAVNVLWIGGVECQANLVRNVTCCFDQGDDLLYTPLRKTVVDDVAIGLPLASEAERFQESVVEWSRRNERNVDMAFSIGRELRDRGVRNISRDDIFKIMPEVRKAASKIHYGSQIMANIVQEKLAPKQSRGMRR